MSIPLPMVNTANQRKVRRIVVLRAPMALRMPNHGRRSKIMMSKPEIMVTPATANISPKIIQTLRSSRSSHEKSADSSLEWFEKNRFRRNYRWCGSPSPPRVSRLVKQVKNRLTVSSAPLAWSVSHAFSFTAVYKSIKHVTLSNCERLV